MSKVLDSPLNRYLVIGGALGAVYALIHFLANRKQGVKSNVSLENTRIIIKEIKYQVYANCIPFAEGVDKKLKANYPAKDLENFLRTQLTKIYQSKQDLILQKRGVSKDEFKIALDNHGKDTQIKNHQAEIFKVLEESINGKIDLTVPTPAYKLYSDKELLGIYRSMCEQIGIKVWEKLMECRKDQPDFNPKDDKHFRHAMRQLGIYEFKVRYLNEKGFKEEWGCPNFVFLKLFEGVKRDNAQIKAGSALVEKGYEKIITLISSDPESYDRIHILRIMQDNINEKQPPVANKPKIDSSAQIKSFQSSQRQVPPPPPAPPVVVRKQAPPVQQKPKDDDEFDMEKLMMEQLLSRSQEEPKQEKVQVKLAVSQPVQVREVAHIQHQIVIKERNQSDNDQPAQQEPIVQNNQEQLVGDSNIPQEQPKVIEQIQQHVEHQKQHQPQVQRHQVNVEAEAEVKIEQRETSEITHENTQQQVQIPKSQILEEEPVNEVPKHEQNQQLAASQQVSQQKSIQQLNHEQEKQN